MEHILKSVPKETLKSQTILVNEYLGISSTFLLEEFAKEYPSHLLVSWHNTAKAYPGINTRSVLEHPEKEKSILEEGASKDLLILDGYNLAPHKPPLPACTVVVVNRSVTHPNYREMYNALLVVSVKPLLSAELLYTGALQIECRALSLKTSLLYKLASAPEYTRTEDA
ncbi:hypothetical protein NECID01_1621 [Nematocida sp. AWRm77]|nr:hypothetical protein NECID01_1621 [Nematocida sp. AWRm77]